MITDKASDKINIYNQLCVHYNLVANSIYNKRKSTVDFFSYEYLSYLIAGLISFDMSRRLGKGARRRYDPASGGFAKRLYTKLQAVKPLLKNVTTSRLTDINLTMEQENIINAYNQLAGDGEDCLDDKGSKFHVGATKILHFINPVFFIIIDRNAANAFRLYHKTKFRDATQPGYSAEKYFECLQHTKDDIDSYGVNTFSSLEKGVPIVRIYDKLLFVSGSNLI